MVDVVEELDVVVDATVVDVVEVDVVEIVDATVVDVVDVEVVVLVRSEAQVPKAAICAAVQDARVR